jgi:iron complex outermembrane receptor protein
MKNRDIWSWGRRASAVAPVVAVGLSMAPSSAPAQTALPQINVIAPTPLAGHSARPKPGNALAAPAPRTGAPAEPARAATAADPTLIDRDKVPSNTSVLTSEDFRPGKSTDFLDSLNRGLPGVSLGDQTGNAFQHDLNYRGFTASPIQGTPQGIAVYQNGVRINEAWGDVVNWDFIPERAINRVSLYPSNPVFGLNAIGGALSIEMKNGFTYQGAELQAMMGSYGRAQSSVQMGRQDGNFSAYAAFDNAYDKGFRNYTASHVNRMYVDVGARNDQTEFHVNFAGADNVLGSEALTPVEVLNKNWSAAWVPPQGTHFQLAFLNSSLSHSFSDTLSFQGNAYYRGFWQSHIDANSTAAQACADGATLCIGDGMTQINQNVPVAMSPVVLNAFNNNLLGQLDRNWTSTNSFGGSAQITSANKVLDHDNHFVMGASVDHGYTQFTASSELGTMDQNLFVTGTGVFINAPDAGVVPVSVHAINTYTGIYATDTFDVTSRLAITAGGRYNVAQINLEDQTGTNSALDSSNRYQRFNPVIGATYKITPNLTAYAGYSEANRAPTPLELACSDPKQPCIIDTFLIADPPLKQVVSHTVEAGLRGGFGEAKTGQLTWGLGAFRTVSTDDIINVASIETGHGYFTNAGTTLRQGIEAKLDWRRDRWNAYANYTFVDATYQSALLLSSPNNPAADGNGNISVTPGDHIPGVPAHRFKVGAEYAVTDLWKVGADLNVVGSQYLLHDDANQNPKVPAYSVLNLHTSYQLAANVELFSLVNNALNQHYYAQGTFFDIGNQPGSLGLTDARTFSQGKPFAAFGGVRARF